MFRPRLVLVLASGCRLDQILSICITTSIVSVCVRACVRAFRVRACVRALCLFSVCPCRKNCKKKVKNVCVLNFICYLCIVNKVHLKFFFMKKIYFVCFYFENGSVIKSNIFFSNLEAAEKYAKGFDGAASYEISDAPLLSRW